MTTHHEDVRAVSAENAEAVRTVLHRYARAVDARGDAALADVLTEDAVLHRADGPHYGREQILAFYRSVFAGPTVWSKHLITNIEVAATQEGFAVSAYFQAVSRTAADARMVLGEYSDLLVNDEDGLRIREKRIEIQQTFALVVTDA